MRKSKITIECDRCKAEICGRFYRFSVGYSNGNEGFEFCAMCLKSFEAWKEPAKEDDATEA